jgi:hypothetical protein
MPRKHVAAVKESNGSSDSEVGEMCCSALNSLNTMVHFSQTSFFAKTVLQMKNLYAKLPMTETPMLDSASAITNRLRERRSTLIILYRIKRPRANTLPEFT